MNNCLQPAICFCVRALMAMSVFCIFGLANTVCQAQDAFGITDEQKIAARSEHLEIDSKFLMRLHLDELIREVKISKKQAKKLEIAGKGVISRYVQTDKENYRALLKQARDMEERGEFSIGPIGIGKPIYLHADWTSILRKNLTEEQFAATEALQVERELRKRKNTGTLFVSALQQQLILSDEQKEQFEKLLDKKILNQIVRQPILIRHILDGGISFSPTEPSPEGKAFDLKVKKILSEKQYAAWSNQYFSAVQVSIKSFLPPRHGQEDKGQEKTNSEQGGGK